MAEDLLCIVLAIFDFGSHIIAHENGNRVTDEKSILRAFFESLLYSLVLEARMANSHPSSLSFLQESDGGSVCMCLCLCNGHREHPRADLEFGQTDFPLKLACPVSHQIPLFIGSVFYHKESCLVGCWVVNSSSFALRATPKETQKLA